MPLHFPLVFWALDDVRIRRDDRGATIDFAHDPGLAVRLELGPSGRALTDQEVLDRWNQRVLALQHGLDETGLLLARMRHLVRRRGAHVCLICIDDV